jgi:hypothetical protein
MDAFAVALAERAGWPPGSVTAVYHESEDGGLSALREGADLAVVPLPFFVKHADALGLAPVLQAVPSDTGATQRWTLVAKPGRVSAPADLRDGEIVSLAGYAPSFVRGVALAGWGPLPAQTRVTASSLVLSSLRKAAKGDHVAVLLDGAQSAALPGLPFAKDLVAVFASEPLPVSVVARVGAKVPAARAEVLAKAMEALGDSDGGKAALEGLRMNGFVAADVAALDAARKAASR